MKITLTPARRRELRAAAHHLDPVVMIGHDGLTAPVLHEIDVNLLAHGLIKIRVFSDDRDARERLLARIAAELDASPVQHIGKLLVVFRPVPDDGERKRASRRAGEPEARPAAAAARRKTVTSSARRPAAPAAGSRAVPGPADRRRKIETGSGGSRRPAEYSEPGTRRRGPAEIASVRRGPSTAPAPNDRRRRRTRQP